MSIKIKTICMVIVMIIAILGIGIVEIASANMGQLTYTSGNADYKVTISKVPTIMRFVLNYAYTDWYTYIPISVKVTKKGTDGVYRAAPSTHVQVQIYSNRNSSGTGDTFNQIYSEEFVTNNYGIVTFKHTYMVPDGSGYSLIVFARVADYYTATKSIGVSAD